MDHGDLNGLKMEANIILAFNVSITNQDLLKLKLDKNLGTLYFNNWYIKIKMCDGSFCKEENYWTVFIYYFFNFGVTSHGGQEI